MSHDFVKPKKIGGLDTNTNAGQRSPFASRPFLATPRSQPQPQDIQTMRERAARYQAANPHLYGTSAQPQTVQRQASETEEESLQMKANESVQRKPEQPDLETLIRQRAARVDTPLQRMMKVQMAEAQRFKQQEDEKLQTKSELIVQREMMPEEEEENLQMQSEPTLQREELSEEEEDKTLQMQSEATVQLKSQDSEQEQAGIQTKLTIGQPGDKYEQEADNMATKVMSMPDPTAENVQRQEIGEKEETLQEKSLVDGITPVVQRQISETQKQDGGSQSLESQLAGEKGGGHPLSDEVRGFMEPRFGADFSDVRVHTGSAAVQMNQQLGAQAFTHGNDIYYSKGKAPGKDALTAHELTHTIQQSTDIRLQPVKESTSQDKVLKKIEYLKSRSQYYESVKKFDLKLVKYVLSWWRRRLMEGTKIIQEEIPQDTSLMKELNQAYKSSLRKFVKRASKFMKETAQDLYLTCSDLIPVWAMPQIKNMGISTPIPLGENTDPLNGKVKFVVNGISITILPDGRKSGRGAHTKIDMSKFGIKKYNYRGGKIVSFDKPKLPKFTIQTLYGKDNQGNLLTEATPSGYGKGTTGKNRSLGFHEGSHGLDYIEYFRDNPIPEFHGHTGMKVRTFKREIQKWKKSWKKYIDNLEQYSLMKTDCVGQPTIDEYYEGKKPKVCD
ncbi:MAG: DUF4157 domain-containing protein [Okeania sp. SIO2F4]|uniref:eCIS core domain-containing protein n=1 Tax=Okeania sp. SIO2F4 TaxID=2607790 RepID=UPI00142B6172|nr:DUF4157 domain-containing protein [Okeania sp. SIO2F4]NES01826.1 DUF4157 domain-containing protein [Okeania sp. SIO2F4]